MSTGDYDHSFWNGDSAAYPVALLPALHQDLSERDISREFGGALYKENGDAASILITSDEGYYLVNADGVHDGAANLDGGLEVRHILQEPYSYGDIEDIDATFARSGDGMPCFFTVSEVEGWVCLQEDEDDPLGYQLATAQGMPDHPLAHPERLGHYNSFRFHMEYNGIRLEAINQNSAIFASATEDADDDESDAQLMYFDGHHHPVRLVEDIRDGGHDDSIDYNDDIGFLVLDGGTKIVYQMELCCGGAGDGEGRYIRMVDIASKLQD